MSGRNNFEESESSEAFHPQYVQTTEMLSYGEGNYESHNSTPDIYHMTQNSSSVEASMTMMCDCDQDDETKETSR